ncbi:LysR family transcriptional regulator ArgP [Jidongwangia harbinensis]|uniref:LysR family transcriptional regulator ArgP n=1 Tax=Jidongwangia harbinensis TaxID=2878561 RepID=UPI001CD98526|nr:LysR family transcriptional regulator ArgP [Jidongwangia harbinensis]MCA2213338.1 LysR family transcriptional regulator ArgP [Jidongwangia harbinensis]
MDPTQLATFQAIVDTGSFEAAARALHVTPSAVSQRIKALEQDVGQVLIRRAKPCEPTEAGRALVRYAGQVALLEREALSAARGALAGAGRTRISVVVNADSLHTWFLPALAGLPGIDFDLHQDDQDHTADLLRAGTAMAAVTAQHVAVQGCRVERLGAMRYRAVAAPALGAVDFATTPMILLNRKDRLQHRFLASLNRRRPDPPIHYVPAAAAFVEAIRLGLGWALMPEQIAVPDLAAGRVVELVPGRHLDVPLYWQYWRMESTVLSALTGAVKTAARDALR